MTNNMHKLTDCCAVLSTAKNRPCVGKTRGDWWLKGGRNAQWGGNKGTGRLARKRKKVGVSQTHTRGRLETNEEGKQTSVSRRDGDRQQRAASRCKEAGRCVQVFGINRIGDRLVMKWPGKGTTRRVCCVKRAFW